MDSANSQHLYRYCYSVTDSVNNNMQSSTTISFRYSRFSNSAFIEIEMLGIVISGVAFTVLIDLTL